MLALRTQFWLIFPLIAFVFLPTKALDYGLFDATKQEIFKAMGWTSPDIAWWWFASFPFLALCQSLRQRLFFLSSLTLFILISAYWTKTAFGYAVLCLFTSIFIYFTQTLAQQGVLRGNLFLIRLLCGSLIFTCLFILFPTLSIFSQTLYENGQFSLEQGKKAFSQPYLLKVIWNSLSVSITVGVLSSFLGLLFALYTTRIAQKTRFISQLFALLPIVTPPFVVGLGVVLLLGRSGYITQFLVEHFGVSKNWLYGFNGIVLAHTLALTPIAFMIIEGALKFIPSNLEEASYTLRGSPNQTFRYVLFPLLKPALANAFLITFVQSLADFSTPFVLGGNYDVLAGQIYFYVVGSQPNYANAGTMGSILLFFSLACFFIQYRWIGRRSYTTLAGKGNPFRPLPLSSGLKTVIICLLSLWILFNAVLYGSIFFGSLVENWGVNHSFTLKHYVRLFGQGLDFGAFPSLIQTLLFALCAAPITAFVGVAMAYLTTRVNFQGKRFFEFLTLLSFAVPGTVAGIAYVMTFNNAPFYLTGTSAIIVLSMVTRNMPVGMRSAIAGLAQIDKSLDEASQTLKASSYKTFVYIILPLLKPAILSALVTSFVRSMTTVSAIIFLVTPNTQVATAYILNRVEDGDYGLAIAYGSTLIILMMGIILTFNHWLYRQKQK